MLLDDVCLGHEVGLAFLEADAVDDALALGALQPALDHSEVRRINTQWHLIHHAHLTTTFDVMMSE